MRVTAEAAFRMVTTMDDQNEAWRRLTDARLQALEHAVVPRRIRRDKKGKPLKPLPYEPGERVPLTKWLELRIHALEMLLRLLLDADRYRSPDLDAEDLETLITHDLNVMQVWTARQIEPDIIRREAIAMIEQAEIILMEGHTWPLTEMEDV